MAEHGCIHEDDIKGMADLRALIPAVEELVRTQTETLVVVKQLADQDRRILYNEIETNRVKASLNQAFERIRTLENTPMYFPEWKKGLILLLLGWLGSAAIVVAVLRGYR